jgi:hypothetical protein
VFINHSSLIKKGGITMKQLYIALSIVVFIVVNISAQSGYPNNTSLEPENYIVPPFLIDPGGVNNGDIGPLLTNGVLVTTFPDYAGNATPMGVAFDGTYYYVIPGGYPGDDVAQLDVNFNLVAVQTVGLDMRSVFYNPADGEVYIKGYTGNGLYRLHTNPFDGGFDIIFTGIFQNEQTKACLSLDGTKMYDHLGGTVREYDFATGTILNTITLNLQHNLDWPRENLLANTGTYILTYAHPVVYAYDPANGNFVSSCTLSSQPSSDEWSMCYTNGYFMLTDNTDATWYVWTIDQGVPVELASFSANVFNNEVELSWITATETNNHGFDLQRKSGNGEFSSIGFINGAGTTTETQAYSYIDKNLSAGSYVYRLKQIDFDGTFKYSEEVSVEVVNLTTFALEQNYPNPFNPSTTIKYSLPENSFVKLALFNLLGEEVAILVNETKEAGAYSLSFDASDLPSGTYIYQLQAGSSIKSMKMVLLK